MYKIFMVLMKSSNMDNLGLVRYYSMRLTISTVTQMQGLAFLPSGSVNEFIVCENFIKNFSFLIFLGIFFFQTRQRH